MAGREGEWSKAQVRAKAHYCLHSSPGTNGGAPGDLFVKVHID
ncbi:hypothetical protein ACFZBE_39885 [Streptomyces sp. NPDC008061]